MFPKIRTAAVVVAIGFGGVASFLPGVTQQAFAFGHGFGGGFHGGFGGGHFGGFHGGGGHFGGFHGGHFAAGHFGGFHGGHFATGRFGGFHGGHFAGARFGHGFAGRQFGTAQFGRGAAFGGARFGQAAAFRGVHAFDPQGFNRNGFGNMGAWNQWGHLNWGQGWNNWGYGYGFWAGPVFWPFFYGDMLTFAFWPYAYYNPFFFYGPDFLLTSILWPGPMLCYSGYCPSYAYGYGPYAGYYGYNNYSLFDVYGYPPNARGYAAYYHWRHRHHFAQQGRGPADAIASANVAETCGGLAPGVTQLPIDRIRRKIYATDAQMATLDQVQAASNQANDILRASCPTSAPLTPVSRLDAVAKRLQAMTQAVDVLRGPLTTFYDSLDDQQRREFVAAASHGRTAGAHRALNQAPADELAALCKSEAQNFTSLPVQRIEDVVKPAADQKAAFDALKTASTTAASDLGASCPSAMPETMAGRLDAISARLQALEKAANAVEPALKTFYDVLSDEQKARFNVIGSASAAASPQETRTGAAH